MEHVEQRRGFRFRHTFSCFCWLDLPVEIVSVVALDLPGVITIFTCLSTQLSHNILNPCEAAQ